MLTDQLPQNEVQDIYIYIYIYTYIYIYIYMDDDYLQNTYNEIYWYRHD